MGEVEDIKMTKRALSKSPNQMRHRSGSPFRIISSAGTVSPWRRRETIKKTGEDRMCKYEVQRSEINILHQLCLDKHIDNNAIEVLLGSSGSTQGFDLEFLTESLDHGSRSLSKKMVKSTEGKKTFLDRFFFKSPRKFPQNDDPSSPVTECSKSGKENISPPFITSSADTNIKEDTAWPQITVPDVRTTYEAYFQDASKERLSSPNVEDPNINPREQWADLKPYTGVNGREYVSSPKATNTKIVAWEEVPVPVSRISEMYAKGKVNSDISDSFSNMSSLSGTRDGSIMTPVALGRNESLSYDSIKDIRKCLKEMERQLGQATNTGQRVSREKFQRALFTVADSLEDEEELKSSKGSQTVEDDKSQLVVNVIEPRSTSSKDDKSEVSASDDGEFNCDTSAFGEDEPPEAVGNETEPFSVLSFFGVSAENQQAVQEVLDDLLWTEFVSTRQEKESPKLKQSEKFETQKKNQSARKISLKIKEYDLCSENRKQKDTGRECIHKSWWRNYSSGGIDRVKEEEEGSSAADDTSTTSGGFPSYLPTSITVKKRVAKPGLERKGSPASHSHGLSDPFRVTMQQDKKLIANELIETESRQGFETRFFP